MDENQLDQPDPTIIEPSLFTMYEAVVSQNSFIHDIMLAHKVIATGVPNRFSCKIPLKTHWNIGLFDAFLYDYQDRDVITWLKYGFTISRSSQYGDPQPVTTNHRGATLFPEAIDEYIDNEIRLGATMGPFAIPPFISRIGISPLSSRPKKDSKKCRIIMDLSFPFGNSVNDGISKTKYYGKAINLKYPTIDTLAKRVAELGGGCLLWKKDLLRYCRQVPLCPRDYSLIGFRWKGAIFFDKVMPMGLQSAAYVCQRITDAIVYVHRSIGICRIGRFGI